MNLAKVICKLSPLLGNLIEFNTVEILNDKPDFKGHGTWVRQDPGFPDTILQGSIKPVPGFEIKAWLPLATEITARFKDSQNHFTKDNTHVAMLAWLPEKLIYGNWFSLALESSGVNLQKHYLKRKCFLLAVFGGRPPGRRP